MRRNERRTSRPANPMAGPRTRTRRSGPAIAALLISGALVAGCGGGGSAPKAGARAVKACMFTQAGIKLCGEDAVQYCRRDATSVADGCIPVDTEAARLDAKGAVNKRIASAEAEALEHGARELQEVQNK